MSEKCPWCDGADKNFRPLRCGRVPCNNPWHNEDTIRANTPCELHGRLHPCPYCRIAELESQLADCQKDCELAKVEVDRLTEGRLEELKHAEEIARKETARECAAIAEDFKAFFRSRIKRPFDEDERKYYYHLERSGETIANAIRAKCGVK